MKVIVFIFSLFVAFSTVVGQHLDLDSINNQIALAENDSALIERLYWKNRYYRQEDSIQKAIEIGEEMERVAKRMNNQEKITWAKRVISYNYFLQDSLDKSVKFLLDYINTLSPKDTLNLAISYQDIGRRYFGKQLYTKALEYYFKAAHYYEMLGNTIGIYANISSTYSRLNDEQNAVKFNLKMIEQAKKDSNYWALASGYLDQGYYYLMLIKHDSSYYYSKKAVSIYRDTLKVPTNSSLGIVYGNIADVYIYYYRHAPDSILVINPSFRELKNIKKGLIDSAKYYIDKSYEIAKIYGNPTNMFYIFYGYGDLLYYQGKIKESEKEFMKCYNISLENEYMIFDRKKVAEQLYKIHKKLGNKAKALKFYEEFIQLRDSIFDKEKQREVGRQEAQFNFERQKAKEEAQRAKEKAIEQARLEQERAVAKEKERNQKIITYSVILGLLLISFFTAVIYKRLKIAKEQQKLIAIQKQTIEKNRNHMLESIEYSKNIQKRIFPTMEEVKRLLPNSFVYFKPKDVVSGDFYWVYRKGNKTFFSVADCTGHGVPGAFMTLISLNLLNAIILEEDVTATNLLLERLHIKLKERLTSSEEEQMKHGLDIAMCAYDHTTGKLEYSGLHNPLYIINKDNELREIKGDNLFLGISKDFNVSIHQIEIKKGDSCYMSTDGFPDQKGGEKGKKFYYSRLRNLLRVVNTYPVEKRVEILDKKFNEWKGDKEQIDDVCIMGVTFK